VIISVLFLQVVPILMTISKSLKGLCYLWRFISKLQPGYSTSPLAGTTNPTDTGQTGDAASANCGSKCFGPNLPWVGRRLYLCFCWLSLFVDTLQPLAFAGTSIYVALYRSNDDDTNGGKKPNLLTAILNVMVLTFLATLDTYVLKTFLELWYGSSNRVCIAMNITYRACDEDLTSTSEDDESNEDHYWRTRARTTKRDVLYRLRTEEIGMDKKWEALFSASAGLGILGDWSPKKKSFSKPNPIVDSVTQHVVIFSWKHVCAALGTSHGAEQRLLRWPAAPQSPIAAFIAAASDDQWAYEVDQEAIKQLLKYYPEHTARFSLKGSNVNLPNLGLGDRHMESLSKMLQIS
ncbi:hypothetical protein Agub_g9418, partial [Astrephomene gubernaculifera]